MKITAIDEYSTGQDIGLLPGDKIWKINGRRIRDILDFRFFITDEEIALEIERDKERVIFDIEKETDDALGLSFEPIKVRMCGNDCPFCFVDQNPAGMRKTLYFRDEDFRLSFLAGHFVTLTNLSNRDLERIVEQRLSPLYVSVHAIDLEIRTFLLGLKKDDRLLEKLKYLTENGIELHTQIVVSPDINDGKVLEETVAALASFYPKIGSVATVPLGLTKHREGLLKMKPVTTEYAKDYLIHADELAQKYKKELGIFFIYPSDEFYIRAQEPIPGRERYDTFEQFENGVGMLRTLLDDFSELKSKFPDHLDQPVHISFVTGMMMHEILEREIVNAFRAIKNLRLDLVVVKNDFYGETIRTTGLLTGQDIYKNCADRDLGTRLYLPKNCVNDDRKFLDDWTLDGLSEKLQIPIELASNDFSIILEEIKQMSANK
ncbi:MAG: DUF512 domain-containing protein [Calditrichaeota bacterium]|nr:MAG: DUF512 domain-containing protein [Calditrichota bacterium]